MKGCFDFISGYSGPSANAFIGKFLLLASNVYYRRRAIDFQ